MIRIATNYMRLILTLVLGLVLIPVLLILVGDIGTGLIGFLGASVGLAAMVHEIARDSMIRELGDAHHSGDPYVFRHIYNSAIMLCFFGGMFTLGLFGLFYLLLPALSIPEELIDAVRIFLVAKALQSFFEIFFSPQFNMLLVYERMFAFNLYQVVHRSMLLIGAGIVFVLPGIDTTSERLAAFGILTAILQTAFNAGICLWLITSRPALRPSIRLFNSTSMKIILGTTAWNFLLSVSIRLHERVGSVLMNVFFGPLGNLIFDSLSFRLASYVRMTAAGMTTGVDAIATRLSATGGDSKIEDFLVRSTHFHAIATFPAAVFVFVMAGPLLSVWIGSHLKAPETTLPIAVWVLRVLLVGITVRCVSDGWFKIFYGAGHISSYAKLVFIGGLCSPLIGILLYYTLPEQTRYLCVALSISACMLTFNGIVAPLRCCRLLNIPFSRLLRPLAKPALVSIVGGICLLAMLSTITSWNIIWLGIAFLGFSTYCILMTLFVLLSNKDRNRLLNIVRRRWSKPREA